MSEILAMEPIKEIKLLNYSDIFRVLREHAIRRSEVPTGFALSLPLPTKRCGGMPGYAMFASPMTLRPDHPAVQAPPDRWWVYSAQGASLLLYALCKVHKFADEQRWEPITMASRPAEEKRSALKALEDIMNELAPAFFLGRDADSEGAKAVKARIEAMIPQELMIQYKALAPDFFQWLSKEETK